MITTGSGTSPSWCIWCAFLASGLSITLGPGSVKGQDKGQEVEKEKERKEDSKATKKTDAQKEAPEDSGAKDGARVERPGLGIDEAYVQENLKQFLNADKLEFDEKGRVTLEFDFSKKKPDHMEVFEPAIDSKAQSNFRYTTGREEHMDYFRMEGIKIANQGRSVLRCWFLDDVEAEIEYIARGSFTPGHMFALCFSDAKNKKALGNNMGTQCTTLMGGAPAGKRQGTVEAIGNATRTKMKMVVRSGRFEAYRGDRKYATMEYNPKDFSTGQLGFAWGGKVAGSVTYLKINGRIDAKKTAELLRKAGRG